MDKGQTGQQLTPKQERFIEEYLVDLNATKAAIRAGYSPKMAGHQGYENLTKPYICQRITDKKAERAKRTELTADMVVSEIRALAFTRLHEFYELVPGRKKAMVRLKPFDELTDAQRAAIKTILNTRVGLAVELYDKDGALKMLGEHLGIFEKHQRQGAAVFNVIDYSKAETPAYDDHGKPVRKSGS